jgi:hypothetical protein
MALAADVFVNDNWVEVVNVAGGTVGVVETGDLVTNSGDPGSLPVTATYNEPAATFPAFQSIHEAINAVNIGGIIHVLAGVYAENLVIAKRLHLRGEDAAKVTLFPAISSPHQEAYGSEPLPGGESNIVLVRANNVEISGITFDGNNPSISTPGFAVDARNGITTDILDPPAPIIGLNVHDMTVQNVYLAGIQSLTAQGTFTFANNTIRNIHTSTSHGIFNLGGSGIIADNEISNVINGIGMSRSRGTTITHNSITDFAGVGISSHSSGIDGGGDAGSNGDMIGGSSQSTQAIRFPTVQTAATESWSPSPI